MNVLYILCRNDLASMNPGKLAAQASHASNAFIYEHYIDPISIVGEADADVIDWMGQTTQGFGTVLTLSVTEAEMRKAISFLECRNIKCNIIHDPTYPLIDGATVHHIPLDTCAYVFGNKDDPLIRTILGDFPLYP